MRSVGHRIHSALIPFLHPRHRAAASLDAAIRKAATNVNNFNWPFTVGVRSWIQKLFLFPIQSHWESPTRSQFLHHRACPFILLEQATALQQRCLLRVAFNYLHLELLLQPLRWAVFKTWRRCSWVQAECSLPSLTLWRLNLPWSMFKYPDRTAQ